MATVSNVSLCDCDTDMYNNNYYYYYYYVAFRVLFV